MSPSLQHYSIVNFLHRHWILIAIISFAFFLRVYHLPSMANYDYDQEFVTNFVLDVTRIYPLRLVGQDLSIIDLFMGPFYFYSLVPFYLLFHLNPIGGAIGSVCWGLATILTYYLVGSQLFSRRVGLLAAFIRTISFFAIGGDWSMLPTIASDLPILLIWFCFYQLHHHHKSYLPLLFFLFGTLTSLHPVQLPFILVFFAFTFIWHWRFSIKLWSISLVAFIAPASPLILFDYYRHWSMTKKVISLFTSGSNTLPLHYFSKLITNFTITLQHTSQIWIPFQFKLELIVGFVTLFAIIIWSFRQHQNRHSSFHLTALLVLISTFILYYTLYPASVPDYYLAGVRTIILLYLAAILTPLIIHPPHRHLGLFFLGLLATFNLYQLNYRWHHPSGWALINKQQIVNHIISHLDKQPFRVSYHSQPGWKFGYQSLFRIKNITPGDTGPEYQILIPTTIKPNLIPDYTSGSLGLIYPH